MHFDVMNVSILVCDSEVSCDVFLSGLRGLNVAALSMEFAPLTCLSVRKLTYSVSPPRAGYAILYTRYLVGVKYGAKPSVNIYSASRLYTSHIKQA